MEDGDASPPRIQAMMPRPTNPFAVRRASSTSSSDRTRASGSSSRAVVREPAGPRPAVDTTRPKPGAAPRVCIGCGAVEDHPVQRCKTWRNYTLKQRQLVVRHHDRCPNCFRPSHPAPCWAGTCPHCPGKQEHNSWLCAAMEKVMQQQKERPGSRK